MENLIKANKARQEKILNKLYRLSNGDVESFKTRIDSGKYSRSEEKDVSSIQYNRRKYNRMNYEEQKEYESKMAITKKEYRLYNSGNSGIFSIVPKMVYDYFNNKNKRV